MLDRGQFRAETIPMRYFAYAFPMRYFAYAFNAPSAALFAVIGWFLIFGQAEDWSSTGRMGIAFIAAISCALVGNLDRIDSIKASLSGIEAKTREAKAVVAEAKQAIEGLHSLAEMTGATLIDMLAGAGRWGGKETEQKDQQRTAVLETLRKIGLPPEAIERANSADRRWVNIDYSLGIFKMIKESSSCSEDLKRAREKMLTRWNGDKNFRPSPDDFKAMFTATPCGDSRVTDLLDDYQYYCEHGQHRRPEVWRDREQWLR
jgi:hypothetical protein